MPKRIPYTYRYERNGVFYTLAFKDGYDAFDFDDATRKQVVDSIEKI